MFFQTNVKILHYNGAGELFIQFLKPLIKKQNICKSRSPYRHKLFQIAVVITVFIANYCYF